VKRCTLAGDDMADEQQVAILKQGVDAWNEWREQNWQVTMPDLGGSPYWKLNLSGANLESANLSGASFREAILREAILREAILRGADLSDADLSGAVLVNADLGEAALDNAHLCGADLRRANLSGTRLKGADMTGAHIGWTRFGDADLSLMTGLDTVTHHGPSTIGIDSLYKSQGRIPYVFLGRAGVPENLIAYVGSLVGRAIEFYSCFISYSSKDQDFAERLHTDLRSKGVRCWFAPEDLKTGDRFQERIEESIRLFDKVMIVLSEASVQSRWVEREVNAAREREDRENRTVLFPIRIDDAVMDAPQPWAADIRRSRHIGDFCRWKDHDAYTQARDRLLRDLKASEVERS